MNWTVIVQSVLTFAGGFVAAYWSFKGSVKKASYSNEGIYAEKTGDLFERIDRLTDERDDLKNQVMKLQDEVQDLTRAVDELKRQLKQDEKERERVDGTDSIH